MDFIRRLIRQRQYLPYCLEALWYLTWCKCQVVFKPFASYAKHYGHAHCETLRVDCLNNQALIHAIRLSLRVVPICLPWHSKCLDQAMAAQKMLARRGFATTLYFGIMHDANKTLLAHAWLRCGSKWVIGYQPFQHYSIVGTYAWYR